jgi:T3SS negative regulator,GrlR
MEDGLYRVEFRTSDDNWGAGVIHVQAGRLWGGDSAMYYLGTLRQVGGTLAVTIKTDRHTQTLPQPILSVWQKSSHDKCIWEGPRKHTEAHRQCCRHFNCGHRYYCATERLAVSGRVGGATSTNCAVPS